VRASDRGRHREAASARADAPPGSKHSPGPRTRSFDSLSPSTPTPTLRPSPSWSPVTSPGGIATTCSHWLPSTRERTVRSCSRP
jgi:hypothetical protein